MKHLLAAFVIFCIGSAAASAAPEIPRELSKGEYDYMTAYIVKGRWPQCRTALSGSVQKKGDTRLATSWAACYDDLVKRKAEKRAIEIASVNVQTYCYVRLFRSQDSKASHLRACQRYY